MYNLTIPGWFSRGDFAELEFLAGLIPAGGRMVEVGSFLGRSAWAWAHSVDPTVTVHCIDPWSDQPVPPEAAALLGGELGEAPLTCSLARFRANTADCPNIRIHQGRSDDILWRFAPAHSIDLVFLDGDHSNPVLASDIAAAERLVRPGGWICGHDFNLWTFRQPDVIREVVALAKRQERPVRFAPFIDSSVWAIQM